MSETTAVGLQFNLRTYQQMVQDYLAFKEGNLCDVVQVPTGGGKTAIFSSEIARRFLETGQKSLVIVHTGNLLAQTVDSLRSNAALLACDNIETFLHDDSPYHALVCTIQALINKSGEQLQALSECIGAVVVDECHHYTNNTFALPVVGFRDVFGKDIIGFTATPGRTDEISLRLTFSGGIITAQDIGATVPRLMAYGNLAGYRLSRRETTDVFENDVESIGKGKKRSGADFSTKDLEKFSENMDYSQIVRDYLRFLDGKPAIVFCPTVKDSQALAEVFNAMGIPAAHADASTKKEDLARYKQEFKDGKILIWTNCALIAEGFDIPKCVGLILAKPTRSRIVHLQQVGRVLRPKNGELAFILDYVGNFDRLGHPEDPSNNSWKNTYFKEESQFLAQDCDFCFSPLPLEPDHENEYGEMRLCPKCGKRHTKPKSGKEAEAEEARILALLSKRRERVEATKNFDCGLALSLSLEVEPPMMRAERLQVVYSVSDKFKELKKKNSSTPETELFEQALRNADVRGLCFAECRELIFDSRCGDGFGAWLVLWEKMHLEARDYADLIYFYHSCPKTELALLRKKKLKKLSEITDAISQEWVRKQAHSIRDCDSYESFIECWKNIAVLFQGDFKSFGNTRNEIWNQLLWDLAKNSIGSVKTLPQDRDWLEDVAFARDDYSWGTKQKKLKIAEKGILARKDKILELVKQEEQHNNITYVSTRANFDGRDIDKELDRKLVKATEVDESATVSEETDEAESAETEVVEKVQPKNKLWETVVDWLTK